MRVLLFIMTLVPFLINCAAEQTGFSGSNVENAEVNTKAGSQDANFVRDEALEEPEESGDSPVAEIQSGEAIELEGSGELIQGEGQLDVRPVLLTDNEMITVSEMAINLPTEIYMLVDTSGSMDHEKAAVAANIASFTSQFTMQGAGLDYHLYLVGNFDAASIPSHPNVTLVNDIQIKSHDALTKYLSLFDDNNDGLGASQYVLPDPLKHQEIIVVSDDETNLSAADFHTALTGKGVTSYSLNGIIGLPTSVDIPDICEIAGVGNQYIAGAASSPIPGLVIDLCQEDWDAILSELGQKISSTIAVVSYPLAKIPASPDFLAKVILDDLSEVDPSNFSIDTVNKTIKFTAPTILGTSVNFDVHYEWTELQ